MALSKKALARQLYPGFKKWMEAADINPNSWSQAEWDLLTLFILWDEFQAQLQYHMAMKEMESESAAEEESGEELLVDETLPVDAALPVDEAAEEEGA